jgi:hypothetical protein
MIPPGIVSASGAIAGKGVRAKRALAERNLLPECPCMTAQKILLATSKLLSSLRMYLDGRTGLEHGRVEPADFPEKQEFDSAIRRFESSRPSQPVRVCRRSPVEALKPRRFPGFPVPIPNRRPRWQRCFGVIAPRRLCSRHLWFGLRARRRQVRQDDARHRRQTHFLRRHDAAVAGDYSTIRID